MLEVHPLGRPWGDPAQRCGTCFWARVQGPGRPLLRCLAARAQRVSADWAACDRHEVEPDCLDCTACCGPAFHVVELGRRESRRPCLSAWVVVQGGRPTLPRGAEGLCPALDPGSGCCRVYDQRPDSCRDFEKGSANCLWARRRAGLSAGFDLPAPEGRGSTSSPSAGRLRGLR